MVQNMVNGIDSQNIHMSDGFVESSTEFTEYYQIFTIGSLNLKQTALILQ